MNAKPEFVRDALYPYQRRWVQDEAYFAIWNKARQIGGTTAAIHQAIRWAGRGEKTVIVGMCEQDAAQTLDNTLIHLGLAQTLTGDSGLRIVRSNANSVHLANGGRILTIPSTSGMKSLHGNVILDEFAFYRHQERVWDSAVGASLGGYKLRVISSPNGSNMFRKLWELHGNIPGQWTRHRTTAAMAADDGWLCSAEVRWQIARNDVRTYDRLFNCSFV